MAHIMLLKIKGHDRFYDIQSMCMMFYPYENMEKTNSLRKKASVKILSEAAVKEDRYICKTVIYCEKKTYKGISASKDLNTLSLRDALKKSFYKAGVKATDIIPPWGVLTGIRPANTAMELLQQGYAEPETEKVLEKEYYILPPKAQIGVQVAKKGIYFQKQSDEKSASLYVSIPFCPSRCRYCSFVSHSVEKALSLLPNYTEALCKEIENTAAEISAHGLKIKTVYIGGGTPTVLAAEQLDIILKTLTEYIDFSFIQEFTVEAGRPDTITKEKLKVIKRYPVTRLCINTQSLNNDVLKAIGRNHTSEEFFSAFLLARNEGFSNINVDLIAGLTDDTPESFEKTMTSILDLRPENITIHTLCVKRAAYLATEEISLLKRRWSDTERMLDKAEMLLKRNGYAPYYLYRQKNTLGNLENIGYALPGKECYYNVYMMDDIHTIVGVGAGAVTKIIDTKTNEIKRVFNYKYPYEYLNDFTKTKNKLSQEGCNNIE